MMLVRAGHGNELVEDFVRLGIVAVGWMKLGDLSRVESPATLESMLCEVYPEGVTASGRPHVHYAEIIEFAKVAQPGDLVATVDGERKRLVVGAIDGPYEFMSERPLKSGGEPYRHALPVKWEYAVTRDSKGEFAFPETRLQGKSAYWLKDETVSAILSARRMPLSAYPRTTRRVAAGPTPLPMSEAPVGAGAEVLAQWLEENEQAAGTLPESELGTRAAAANPHARKIESSGTVYVRDSYVAAYAKQVARGVCGLCKSAAPFHSTSGEPYLESHHVNWLSRGGSDSIENVVALCPNCHRKMHVRDEESDKRTLLELVASRG